MSRLASGGEPESRAQTSGLVHTTSVRRRISLTLHGALTKCIVGPSIRLRGRCQKVEKCSTFQAAPDPSANQIEVMQIHSTRFLDPFCNNKKEEAGKIRPVNIFKEMWNNRIVFSHLFVSSFVWISTHRICRGRRFDWLQYASTKTNPLYVRPALGHPPTDACSVNKAFG